jgi:ABC-2 type transport system ATP-binding protein
VITVRGLTKRYGDVLAVDDLTFAVEPGTVTGFLGPNGAGKSTTMRMVLGLDRPDLGEALVPAGRRGVRRAAAEVGALLDPGAMHPGRRGRDHLRVSRGATASVTGGSTQVLEQVGLVSAARRRIEGYSLGMRQRLGIAHGAARRPARAAVRRADQRPRPRRRPVDPGPAAPARRRGAAPSWSRATS